MTTSAGGEGEGVLGCRTGRRGELAAGAVDLPAAGIPDGHRDPPVTQTRLELGRNRRI